MGDVRDVPVAVRHRRGGKRKTASDRLLGAGVQANHVLLGKRLVPRDRPTNPARERPRMLHTGGVRE